MNEDIHNWSHLEFLEQEIYLLLFLSCVSCDNEWESIYDVWEAPQVKTAHEAEMVAFSNGQKLQGDQSATLFSQIASQQALEMGWRSNADGNAICPECAKKEADILDRLDRPREVNE